MASFAVFSFAVDETSTEMYKPGIEPQDDVYMASLSDDD
jgi:hypothetical protein